MTVKEVKQELRRYKGLNSEVKAIKATIKTVTENLISVKAIKYENRGCTGIVKPVEEAVEQIEQVLRGYLQRQADIFKEMESIEKMITNTKLSEIERSILIWRYINGVSFREIPDMLHISEGTMWRAYKEAIRKVAQNEDRY